jgi:hypothetical protein
MLRTIAGAVMLICAIAVMPFGASDASEPPAGFTDAPCTAPFFATTFEGDPNSVLVRAVDLRGSFAGTITAYGSDRTWTATIERAALVDLRDGGREASVVVRADGPIEGIAYAPNWAPCTFRAGTLPRNDYETRGPQRPVLLVGNMRPLDPASCAKPYVSPTVLRAVEPITPVNAGAAGVVRVAVALDARGAVQSARVIASPSKTLNVSAVGAAARSEYSAAVFRCEPAPGSYEFAIEYNP